MEPVEYPINGELDLHLFQPREAKPLVEDYLQACLEKGILEVRVVHGKGKGVLARTVHHTLERLEIVESFELATAPQGGWGATIVRLKPPDTLDPP